MKLTQIDLRTTFKSDYTEKFAPESWAVAELYWSYLREYSTPNVQKVNIFISDDFEDSLTEQMQVKGFKEAFINFDFAKYFSLDKLEKKRMQLEAIHNGMMQIADAEKWEKQPLIDAYNNCLEKNLEYQFFVGTAKSSPDKKHKINFWCNWDIDIFEVYSVLYDKNNNEIERKKIIEKSPYDGEFIYYAKWKWLDNTKVLLEDKYKYGNNEKWEITIDPVIFS
ncbi:MAG: hypothetical protein ACN6N7_07370 [Chryseobacterium culicis]